MIPPQELRIGNYVLWQGKIVEVISIMPRWACVRDDDVTFSRSYEEFQPVPITEERLDEFGFVRRGEFYSLWVMSLWVMAGLLFYCAPGKRLFIEVFAFGNSIRFDVNTQYVHQLQNLYYDFRGEEIKRKQP